MSLNRHLVLLPQAHSSPDHPPGPGCFVHLVVVAVILVWAGIVLSVVEAATEPVEAPTGTVVPIQR